MHRRGVSAFFYWSSRDRAASSIQQVDKSTVECGICLGIWSFGCGVDCCMGKTI